MAAERLQKILSHAGVASRRVAEELIVARRVAVNGQIVSTLGGRADPDVDEVTLDGVPVLLGRYRYFALNKPAGVVTTARDDQGRDTVFDLVPIGDIQLHPVGRLDLDSEGLLILTNDGHLTDLLTHPRNEVEKEYLVGITARLAKKDIERLVRGVDCDGERLRAASARPAAPPAPSLGDPPSSAPAWLLVVLKQGRNRELRRMLQALDRDVLLLRRIRIGPLHLGTLGPGAFREITEEEVTRLYAAGKDAGRRRDEAEAGAGSKAPRP
jgi:23S rRNA pseudouridine2605 synthase